MSIKNKLRTPGFCVLPFIEKYMSHDSTNEYYCCFSRVPIENKTAELIEVFGGNKIKQCESCYQLEQHNVISPRQRETVRWFKDSEVMHYLENWKPDSKQQIFFYDVRADNKCNLACITCNPFSSTLWQKELGIEIQRRQISSDMFDQMSSAKKIYLAGGEPFIIQEFVALLEKIADCDLQPEVVINTNLTRLNDKLKSCLGKIKKLALTISVDSGNSVNEYHRWPMTWKKFIDNLEFVSTVPCYKMFNSVVDAVSVLNIGSLVDIEHYIDHWSLTILSTPSELLIENLPAHAKETARASVHKLTKSKFYTTCPEFKSKVNRIAELIDCNGDPSALATFIERLDQRRSVDHENYLGINLIK
jgi:hypothetical protein